MRIKRMDWRIHAKEKHEYRRNAQTNGINQPWVKILSRLRHEILYTYPTQKTKMFYLTAERIY